MFAEFKIISNDRVLLPNASEWALFRQSVSSFACRAERKHKQPAVAEALIAVGSWQERN